MRRSATALGFASAAIALVSVWLVDPLGWFARPPTGANPAVRASPGNADEEQGVPALQQAPLESRQSESAQEQETTGAAPAEDRAVFRLVHGAGEPERGARVVVAREKELLFHGNSDEGGEVALAADGQEAQLVARSRNRPMEAWTVRLDGGVHELRLAEGARVAGRLQRDDGAEVGRVFLQLEADRPLVPSETLSDVVWAAFGLAPSQTRFLFGRTEANGSFEFSGLPASWKGDLQIVGEWRVRSASHGEVQSLAGRVRLAEPADDLLIVLAARAALRGRLLAASDGAPLSGSSLCARLRAPGETEPELVYAQADQDGRFELASARAAISAFELRFGNLFEESLPILELEGAAVPLDGELGDLLVEGVRDVRFLLHEAGGAPIQGGFARAAGIQSEPTDSEGRSQLRKLPTSARRLWAEAAGFVPREIELGPALPDPLRIQLEPASVLEVRLRPPKGGSLSQFKVVVRREEGVVAGPVRNKLQQMAYVGASAMPTSDLWNAPLSSYLAATAEEPSGVATFRALALGVALELEVRGITGPEVYHRQTLVPFHAGEERRIEVALGEGLVVFRGRVVDAAGEPLARATVQRDGAILGWTDEQGGFLYFLVNAGPGTLVVQHEGCSTLFLHDYVVPPGGEEVVLRLNPARNVTIEVVDESGAPVPEAEVWILQEGFITNTHRIDIHRHVASSLTDNVFQIETRVGGRKYLQDHSSDRPEARVVVPVHGSVLAQVTDATTSGRPGRMRVLLTPSEGQPGDPLVGERASAPELAFEFGAVLPGSYTAVLQYVPTDDERAAGAQELESAPQTIDVKPRQRTEVRLEL
jgi:hypothetical protein